MGDRQVLDPNDDYDDHYDVANDARADEADNLASSGFTDPLDDDPLLDSPPMGDPYWTEDFEW